jgi:hypothetical protein
VDRHGDHGLEEHGRAVVREAGDGLGVQRVRTREGLAGGRSIGIFSGRLSRRDSD